MASAFLLLYLAARLSDFNTITPILVSMIGLGVGIDYTLFIVTRFRQMLHDGLTPPEAAAAAGATAGRAVIFAGTTVAISITGLAFIGIDFITKLGVGSALGVLTAVILANTLLPAILSLLGHKIDRGRLGMKPADESREGQARDAGRARGAGSSRATPSSCCRSSWSCCASSPSRCSACASAWPTRAPRRSSRPRARRTTCCPARTASAPASPRRSRSWWTCADDPQSASDLEAAMKQVPGVAQVVAPIYNTKDNTADGASVAIINAYSKYAPQDAKTDDIVSQLRDTTIPDTLKGSSAQAFVSGQNAAFTDIGDRILSNSPKFLLYIIGVTFLLLAMAFRSIVVALKAALTTLISALVGFGVLVFVVQMGHGMGVIGLDRTGPIESFVPPIAFAIIFGLSMDYEVFLMSRIREEHVHGADTLNAVRDGVSGVGRVIVAAALIMATVFFAFMLNPDRVTKEFGLLLGVAILTDALLVRMTLVPSLLTLLGERSWAMPGWLDRILPNLTIEPPAESRRRSDARAGSGRGRLGAAPGRAARRRRPPRPARPREATPSTARWPQSTPLVSVPRPA